MDTLNWNRAATCAHPAPGVEAAMIQGLHAPDSGRGSNNESTSERLHAIRQCAGRLFGFAATERIVFTSGATYGLNIAIHGGIKAGERVLTTAYEHNAVLRPVVREGEDNDCSIEILPFDDFGVLDLAALAVELEKGADWLVMGVASNLMGTIQPFEQAVAMAKAAGTQVILDLAQGGGYFPIDLDTLGVSYASIAGHKGLHGPRGVGLLFVARDCEPTALVQGGTGLDGLNLGMCTEWPQRLEVGTPNYPGIFGLGAALDHLEAHPVDLDGPRRRMALLETLLRADADFEVFPSEPVSWGKRLPILAVQSKSVASALMASWISQTGLEVRSGDMCAAKATPQLGVPEGVLRLSPPLDATDADFERVYQLLIQARDSLSD